MIDYPLPANHIAPSAGTWPVMPVPWCGGVSRVAKGADCKSAGLRLRRFESYLPHQPSLASRATLGKPCSWPTAKRAEAAAPKPKFGLLSSSQKNAINQRGVFIGRLRTIDPLRLLRVTWPARMPVRSPFRSLQLSATISRRPGIGRRIYCRVRVNS
jgi:hypothetical protein